MATVLARNTIEISKEHATVTGQQIFADSSKEELSAEVDTHGQNLGVPAEEKRFWWQRGKSYDPNAIATLPSVYDDPETAKLYQPRSDWENLHRFDPSARWTWGEEYAVLRKIDLKIMIFACIMFMSLELDRANIQQAVTDNFLEDLGMDTNDYNWGNTVFKLSFLCAELPSQLVSKWIGPDRWIPAQMVLWSIVAASQFWLSGRSSFLTCRALLALLQGGFIPDMILYLSYFYKHAELSIRLGFWWTAMSIADILAAFFGFGLLHLRGHLGYSGWRWLFLVEGLLTLVLGLLAFGLMPPSPTQTKNWFRGKNGWFTEREETIMVNRIIREDPSKGTMHNRQPITPRLLWESLSDYDLWPLYLLGLNFQTPYTTPYQYLTLTLKQLGFGTFKTNLLVIPSQVGHIITMLSFTYLSEVLGQLWIWGLLAQLWVMPFLSYIYAVDINSINKWTAYGIMTLLLSYPSVHAIQVGWNSRNSNSVRSRTVSAAMYNMACQSSGIIASNIYRKDDRPRYRRGNRVLVALNVINVGLYAFAKLYYTLRNRYRDRKWESMTAGERTHYLATTKDKGNKRLDFRFAT
ncbi:putative transporter [Cyphellophora attinorum]|uniref:Putative transporter n=1 Tax=Cyphellophora attinorum TaxID=1664694 RepID=A0A0N1H2J8_9EURO|nr:putative transporter [Phialophora attinorum]KPI34576.1 putative transporter [Phialophora attinorum]